MPDLTSKISFSADSGNLVVTLNKIASTLKIVEKNAEKVLEQDKIATSFRKNFIAGLEKQNKTLKDIGISTAGLTKASRDYASQVIDLNSQLRDSQAANSAIKQLEVQRLKELEKIKAAEKRRLSAIKALQSVLAVYGQTIQDTTISTRELTQAYRGQAGALTKLKVKVTKHVESVKASRIEAEKEARAQQKSILKQKQRGRVLKELNLGLRKHNKTLKDVRIDTDLLRKAVLGHAGALTKVKAEVATYTNNLKGLNKATLFGTKHQRNLNMSFSVFRSKLLLASFAVGLITRTIGRWVTVAADAEEIQNKFNVVFKESADSAREFADDLGVAVGRSSVKIQEMLALLQDTFVPMGFSRDKASDLSKALVQLSIDVGSLQNKSDDEVLRAFQSAIVGNHEAVRDYGIMLTESTLKTHALKEGIIDTDRELTAQEKILTRVSLLFKMSSDAHSDSQNTLASYSNQVKSFNGELYDLQILIGQKLEPAAAHVLHALKAIVKIVSNTDRLIVYGGAVAILALYFNRAALSVKNLRRAMQLLNGVMTKNKWMLLFIVAVEGIIYAKQKWFDKTEGLTEAEKKQNQVIRDQTANIKRLIEEIQNQGDSVDTLREKIAKHEEILKTQLKMLVFIEEQKAKGWKSSKKSQEGLIALKKAVIQALKDELAAALATQEGYQADQLEKLVKKYQKMVDIQEQKKLGESEATLATIEMIRAADTLGLSLDNLPEGLKALIKEYVKLKVATDDASDAMKAQDKINKELVGMYAQTKQGQIDALLAQKEKVENDKENAISDEQKIVVLENLNSKIAVLEGRAIEMGGAVSKALNQAFDPSLGPGEALKGFMLQVMQMMQQAILATGALNKALTFAWIPGLGGPGVLAALASLEIAKAAIRSIKFAEHGMNEVVTSPTMIVAGEAGPEHVNITPLSGGGQQNSQGSSININISGGVVQEDYIRNELIPALNRATGTGTKLNA